MPANFTSGLFVRKPAWHGQGIVLDDFPADWDEARKIAGLDWEPVLEPVYVLDGIDATTGQPIYAQLDGTQVNRRSDNGFVLARGVSEKYENVTHALMGEIMEALVGVGAKYETTICLEGGKQVASVAYLDEPFTIPGDASVAYPYVAILNRHDGEGACKAVNTTVRVVCANTFAAADMEAGRTGREFTFRHKAGVSVRIEEAKEALRGVRVDAQKWIDRATTLSQLHVEPRQVEMFLAEFFPMPPKGVVSDRVVENVLRDRSALQAIIDGPTCEGIADTAYGLVQAAGEWLDHIRAYKSGNTYMKRTLLRPEPQKMVAMKMALAVASE